MPRLSLPMAILVVTLAGGAHDPARAGDDRRFAWHEYRYEQDHHQGHEDDPPRRWRDDAPRYEGRQRPGLSLDEAVERAERQSGGRVLSAQTLYEGGRPVYRIKLLTPSGRVRVLHLDAGGY